MYNPKTYFPQLILKCGRHLDVSMWKLTKQLSIIPIGDVLFINIDSTKCCIIFQVVVVFVNKYNRLTYPGIHPKQRTPEA